MADLDWVDQLKVADLKKHLKKLGENATGKKAVLVERLKTALAEQDEEKDAAEQPEEEMETDEKQEEPAKEEDKTLKGGLNELLGDGKDDLEFVFESEKPNRKKQKIDDKATDEKATGDVAGAGTNAALEEGTLQTTEKKMTEDDLVDFETAHQDVKEPETPGSQQQGTEANKADVMELEAPVIAEEDRTCALRIQNFVRPFTEKAAKEMLSAYGTVVDMWMPPIKTHCYLIYEKESEAHDAYLGTYNVVWPRGGKHLLPKFVLVDDAKKAIEEGRSRAAFARASGSATLHNPRQPFYTSDRGVPEEMPSRGPPRSAQKPALSLEDLFFKTQAKPPIYYLPLTDEQVAEKKRLASEREAQSTQPPQGTTRNA